MHGFSQATTTNLERLEETERLWKYAVPNMIILRMLELEQSFS